MEQTGEKTFVAKLNKTTSQMPEMSKSVYGEECLCTINVF
jgi:hypothetical protein